MLSVDDCGGLLHVRAGGRLEPEDYERFVPLFETLADRAPGSVPMLIDLGPDFAGWSFAGLWRDAKFDVKHNDRFGRIAVVGDRKWEKWGSELAAPFFPGTEMRFFDRDQGAAEAWARGRG